MENRNLFSGKKAREYDRFFETAYGRTVFELEKELLLKVLNRKETLLEVGCGTGIWMETLKKEGFSEPIGLDISRDMLEIAREKGLRKLVLGNAEILPFKPNSVDTTLFITSLEFMKNRKKAFLEAVRVTRKSVVVAFLNRYSVLSLYRFLRSLYRKSVYKAANFLTIDEVKQLARYAREILRDKIIAVDKIHSTLNLTIDGFVSRELEETIGFNSPFGGFTVIKLYIRDRHETGKRDNS